MGVITNEVLASKIDVLNQRTEKVEIKVDNLPAQIDHKYISHEVFELRMKEYDLKIAEINRQITSLLSKRWVQNTLSAILGAILTGLIGGFIYFLFHRQ